MNLTRRRMLTGLVALPLAAQAPTLRAEDTGLDPQSSRDQSDALQRAIDAAAASGRVLELPAATIVASELVLRGVLRGSPGRSVLRTVADLPVVRGVDGAVVVEDVVFDASGLGPDTAQRGLVEIPAGGPVTFRRCSFSNGRANGVVFGKAEVLIEGCRFSMLGQSAIFSFDGGGAMLRGNRIADCGNAGIRIWRSASGLDGSVVSGNRIERIGWTGGGNGQNGNGINIFKADGVVVSDNVIADCAFTAVRINAANNTQVRGNTCLRSGEVAIFSEFGFSGSAIADNIVDGAAGGISITNLDSGGRLATCSGNIVRNITPRSAVNPDTRPFGIFAEADAAIAGNSVDNVPGIGILAGWGPFLRGVAVTGNVVSGCVTGIGVSVAEGAGTAAITGNIVSGADGRGIVGMAWTDVVSDDLARDAARFPNVTITGNAVSKA